MPKIEALKRWSVLDTRRPPSSQVYEMVSFRRPDGSMFLAKVQQKWILEGKGKFRPVLDLDSLDDESFKSEVERYIGMLKSVGCAITEVTNENRIPEAEAPEAGEGI